MLCAMILGEQKRPSKLPASLSHLTARDKMQRADGDHVQTLVKRQDETLTDVAERLGRLQKSAEAIGTELRSQGKMLDELGEDVEEARNGVDRVDRVTRGIGKLLKTRNNCQIVTVIAWCWWRL
jgi:hypothetical protein